MVCVVVSLSASYEGTHVAVWDRRGEGKGIEYVGKEIDTEAASSSGARGVAILI